MYNLEGERDFDLLSLPLLCIFNRVYQITFCKMTEDTTAPEGAEAPAEENKEEESEKDSD